MRGMIAPPVYLPLLRPFFCTPYSTPRCRSFAPLCLGAPKLGCPTDLFFPSGSFSYGFFRELTLRVFQRKHLPRCVPDRDFLSRPPFFLPVTLRSPPFRFLSLFFCPHAPRATCGELRRRQEQPSFRRLIFPSPLESGEPSFALFPLRPGNLEKRQDSFVLTRKRCSPGATFPSLSTSELSPTFYNLGYSLLSQRLTLFLDGRRLLISNAPFPRFNPRPGAFSDSQPG